MGTNLILGYNGKGNREEPGTEVNAVLTGHPMTQIKLSQGKVSPPPALLQPPQEKGTGLCLPQILFLFSPGNSGYTKEYSYSLNTTLPAMHLLLAKGSQTSQDSPESCGS